MNSPKALDALKQGVTIDELLRSRGRPPRAQQGSNWLNIGLREGKNREVKRIATHLGLTVNRLIRTSFGPFVLGELRVGAVEEVKRKVLAEQLGAELSRTLGVKS